jgi:hypothetical protein
MYGCKVVSSIRVDYRGMTYEGHVKTHVGNVVTLVYCLLQYHNQLVDFTIVDTEDPPYDHRNRREAKPLVGGKDALEDGPASASSIEPEREREKWRENAAGQVSLDERFQWTQLKEGVKFLEKT